MDCDYLLAPSKANALSSQLDLLCKWMSNLNRLNYISVINCKNRYGKYSKGRKVTGIYSTNNSEALITTADSRIRLLNLDV